MLAEAGPIDLLVANAGIALWEEPWETDLDEWWHVLEVNVLGAYLMLPARAPRDDRARRRPDRDHRQRRRVLPARPPAPTARARRRVCRFGEVLAKQVEPHGVKVFVISPGLVRTEMTEASSPTTRPGRRPSWRRSSSASSRPAASTRSPAATSTPSTTRRTSSSSGSTAILAEDLNAIRLRREQ